MIDCKHYSFILYYYLPPFSQDERGVANDEDVIIGNDIVENTIAGAFQLDPATQNRVIQAMNRRIRWENSGPPAW